jgi:hypothetical protein
MTPVGVEFGRARELAKFSGTLERIPLRIGSVER